MSEIFDLLAEQDAFYIKEHETIVGVVDRSDVFRFLSQEG